MNTDGEACEIENQDNPTVGMGFVGVFFPLENEPEYQCGKHRRIGINFAFDGRIPEGVAPGIGQGTGQTATHDDDGLGKAHLVFTIGQNHACKVGNGPE